MKSKITFSRLRAGVFFLLFGLLVFCTVRHVGIGTLCAYCPAGILQTAAASVSFTLHMAVSLAVAVMITLLLGRFFCSWGCPTSFIRGIFGAGHSVSVCRTRREKAGPGYYSAYAVLAAAIAGSFAVGFPVFCLVCPIGLFFGFIFAVHRLFVSYQPGWELIIFPLVIMAEVFLFKKWCGYICPLGAFFRLVNKAGGRFIELKADPAACSVLKGHSCHICANSCAEGISVPVHTSADSSDCVLCLNCKDECPNGAVKVRFSRN